MKHLNINGHELVTKNKLQSEVKEYLKSMDRMLIDRDHLPMFKSQILHEISKFNVIHPRCKPVEASGMKLIKTTGYCLVLVSATS